MAYANYKPPVDPTGGFRETLLIGLASVYLGLLQQVPTEDSFQLMRSRAIVCSDRCASLAETMRGAMRKSGLVNQSRI
jgi:hypothetical protein